MLRDMENIGPQLEKKLQAAGIATEANLIQVGSREAFRRIRRIDNRACLSMLYALEGAVQGMRWHHLAQAEKDALKLFYQEL